MDTLVQTGAQVKFEFGMGTVFATVSGKVWKCEGEGVPEKVLCMYERALQGRVKDDLGMQPPLASGHTIISLRVMRRNAYAE